uniref:SWIRM domain-containing protein n=1 Tax=Clastoptera arizonana TaxID=38151 RepID=A0A1B6CZF4_9HEMI
MASFDQIALSIESDSSKESESEEVNIIENLENEMIIEDDEFIQPLHLNSKIVNDPPRVLSDPLLAGYNPFRSDFEVEYDNRAEDVLALLYHGFNGYEEVDDSEDGALLSELKVAIVDGYNMRLSERAKRKRVIKEHGLINIRKLHTWSSRIEFELGKDHFKHMMRFMQFTKCFEFDKLLASMSNFNSIRAQTNKLLNYRHQGMRLLKSYELYEKLLKHRQESVRNVKSKSFPIFSMPCQPKKPAAPLKIYHLPGFKQLNGSEVTLCSNQRLVPKDFLKFKQALISECEKSNGLRLAVARTLIKIDVNKTRKLFDYLMENGLIWKPKE